MFSIHATGVGGGIAIGRAHIIRRPGAEIPEYNLDVSEIELEIERLGQAWSAARA